MQDTAIGSQLDTLLFAIPFLSFLVFGFFRLDEVFAAHRKSGIGSRRAPSGVDEDGMQILSDPDGRLWHKPRLRQSGICRGRG
jgi:hypothetical protein